MQDAENKKYEFKLKNDLLSVSHDWQNLIKNTDADPLFCSYSWAMHWLHTYPHTQVKVFVCYDEKDSVVALIPCYQSHVKSFLSINFNALRIFGDQGTGAEYPAFLVRKDQAVCMKNLVDAFVLCLQQNVPEWDFFYLPNQAEWPNPNHAFLHALNSRINLASYSRSRSFSAIQLSADWQSRLSKNIKKSIRQTKQRLVNTGETIAITLSHEDTLDDDLTRFFNLHRLRWQSEGKSGAFSKRPERMGFYRSFTKAAQCLGWLRLYKLSIGDDVVAMQLGYVVNKRFYAMQAAFDPNSIKGISHYLRHSVITQLIEEGVHEYDYLGEHTPYKARWQAKERFGKDTMLVNKKLKTWCLTKFKLWPTGRFFKQSHATKSPPAEVTLDYLGN